MGEQRLVRDGHARTEASRASVTPRTDRRRARSSRSTPTRRTTSSVPPWRRIRTGTSSWCGRATARPGRTPATEASRVSATTRTDRRKAPSSRSTPTRRLSSFSLRGGGCRRRLRRGVAELRLVRDGHERLQHPGPALRLGRIDAGRASSRSTPTRRASSVNSSVAADAEGDFVVVWESYGSSGTDTSGFSVQGQRYASERIASGRGVPGQLLYDERPGISLRGGGCGRGLRRGVGQRWLVTGRTRAATASRASATPRTDRRRAREFQVNTYTTSQQYSASLAAVDGGFIVVWQSDGFSGTDPATPASWASASAWPPPCRRCRRRHRFALVAALLLLGAAYALRRRA